MPSIRVDSIPRARVITALEGALDSHCLVVLTAPLGHGKTTIAQELMRHRKSRSLYLKIKPGWNENADFLWDEACTKLGEQGLPDTEALKLMGYPNDDARLYRCLSFFRKHLSASSTLLVVDDLHYADETALPRFFESLVNEEIEGFNLLILSRTKPPMHLAYLEVQGHAAVLDPKLLEFSRDEARQLFDKAGEHDHELADTALDFSHGWAAALRLCLQSYLADTVIKPGNSIEELLSDTFFQTYSQKDQCLLLQLAVLGTFSTAQAVFLTGEDETAVRLQRLSEQNAFIQYSPKTDTYSLHALLRSFLLQNLAEKSSAACEALDIPLLYRRAAKICLQSKDYFQATRFFAQAGTDEDMLRILREFEIPGEGFFMLADSSAVRGIIESIPWEIRFLAPVGYLGFIHRYAVRISRADGADMMREAESRFLEEGLLSEEKLLKVRGELELVRAVCSFNDIEAICECYEKADLLLQGRSRLVNKNMFWTYNCPHSAFLYLKKTGGYAALEELVSEKLIHFRNVSGGANAGATELLTAERFLETGKTHDVEELANTAKYKALEGEQYSAVVAANFLLARNRLANGVTDGVYDLLALLREPVEKRSHPLLLHNLEVCQGYIASVCNDVERIPSWLLQQKSLPVRNNQAHAFSLVVRGKAIMTLKNWPRLLAFAEEVEPQMIGLGSLFGRLHVSLFKTIAAANMQKHTTALSEKHLLHALDLAGPDKILTSIAEYGGHLYPLLQRLGNLHPERRDLGNVLRLTKKYAKLGKKSALKLTMHEMNIMEMVRTGANNKDIGAKLGITQGSVANSLSRIYNKLGVGSRVEAINKWAEEANATANDDADATPLN